MNPADRFQKCMETARRIVQAYRDEAPEGCDPQNSMMVIGIAGVAVSAGGAIYSAQQQKKAAKKAAGAMGGMETEMQQLGDPAQIDPMAVLSQLYNVNSLNTPGARQQAASANKFNINQALKAYNRMLPGFSQLQAQIGANANSFARGELPADVQSSITRAAAQRGIQGGFGFGSQGASGGALGNLNLRNLGLTSLDLSKYGTQLGMQASLNAKALSPTLATQQDYLLTPGQMLGIEQFNVGARNQFALANNGLANQSMENRNQLLYNQAQQQYAGDLMQAQMVAQGAQAVGGAMTGFASQNYGGTAPVTRKAPTQVSSTPKGRIAPTV